MSEMRLQTLERRTSQLDARLAALELRAAGATAPAPMPAPAPVPVAPPPAWPAGPAPAAAPPPPPPPPPPAFPPIRARPQRAPNTGLEDLLGGRILAWTGGVAVVLGIVLLLTIAIRNGWIGETARVLMAGVASLALVGAGAWLQERRQRTDAALAATSAGIAGLFATVVVGGPGYGVLPVGVALAIAFGTGALATALAIRCDSRGVAALGIVGALLAPILAGAPSTGGTLALLWIAALSGTAVLVWRRWSWLALAVFYVPLGQWIAWLVDTGSTAGALLVLVAFGALNAGAAIGYELRVPAVSLRVPAALLLVSNATALAIAGWFVLAETAGDPAPHIWLGGLAAAHLAAGLATAATSINRDVRLLCLTLGVLLADVTAMLVLDGAVLAAAWAVATAGFALLARRELPGGDLRVAVLLGFAVFGHLSLAALQALAQVPPDVLAQGTSITLPGHAAMAAVAAGAFTGARLLALMHRSWRIVLDSVALASLAYVTAITLDGPALAAAFAAEALLLGIVAARAGDTVAGWGGGTFLALALGHALIWEAPPQALVTGLVSVPEAALVLGAAALAALYGARLLGRATEGPRARLAAQTRNVLTASGLLALLYLASTALVTPFQPSADAELAGGLFDLGARQLGQALLSGLWAIAGLAALVTGLLRDDRALRLGSLALLGVTIGKVFLYDLAALTSLYRVGSFIALGLLLLLGAGLWQRIRPRPLPDVAAGVR